MHFDSVLLLAYYHPRYIDMLRSSGNRLRKHGYAVTTLFADEHYKEEVIQALQKPFDLVIYFGHGEPGALCGYRVIRQTELSNKTEKSFQRTIFALCCCSLDKSGAGTLADTFISTGLARRVVGYKGKIKFEQNKKMLERLCDDLAENKEFDQKRVLARAKECGITNLAVVDTFSK